MSFVVISVLFTLHNLYNTTHLHYQYEREALKDSLICADALCDLWTTLPPFNVARYEKRNL